MSLSREFFSPLLGIDHEYVKAIDAAEHKECFSVRYETKEMYLAQIHPRVTVEDVKKDVPWDLKVASDLTETTTLRMRRSILSGDLPRLSLRGGSCPWN